MLDKKKNALSVANYRDVQGNLIDPSTLSDDEKIKFHLANLMKQTIEVLEVSISNDRIYTRAKFSVMGIFHDALEKILEK